MSIDARCARSPARARVSERLARQESKAEGHSPNSLKIFMLIYFASQAGMDEADDKTMKMVESTKLHVCLTGTAVLVGNSYVGHTCSVCIIPNSFYQAVLVVSFLTSCEALVYCKDDRLP